jgi:hypothetical protein
MTTIQPFTPLDIELPPDERATAFMQRIRERVAAADAVIITPVQFGTTKLKPIPPGRPSWLIEVGMKPPPPNPRRARWILFPGQTVVTP